MNAIMGRPSHAVEADIYAISGMPVSAEQLRAYLAAKETAPPPRGLPAAMHHPRFRQAFFAAGCYAMEAMIEDDGWVQLSLQPGGGYTATFYAAIADAWEAADKRFALRNAFFMHKPPGLRLRFQGEAAQTADLARHLLEVAGQWHDRGLTRDCRRDIYEPEAQLFGGKASMQHVHRLFTRDSRYWLAHHRHGRGPAEAMLAALAMLRCVFRGLGIVDWEDLGVWEKVRARTGRSFPEGVGTDTTGIADMSDIIVRVWNSPADVFAVLKADTALSLETAAQELHDIADAWKRDYFQSGEATIGARAAAALYAIFLFNRAGLSLETQVMITEALVTRGVLE